MMGLKKGLALAATSAALAITTGCASLPGKIALTPLTVARDIVDLPLASTTTYLDDLSESRRYDTGRTRAYPGWSNRGGWFFGTSTDVTSPVAKLLSYVLGATDYVTCRSLYPNFPKGISPLKRRYQGWNKFLFPNTGALWEE